MSMHRNLIAVVLFTLAIPIVSCGGSSADVVESPLPPPVDQPRENYIGPPATTVDIQRYKLNLWDNISSAQRCGACHIEASQSPEFVRADDINLAYAATNPLVNLQKPEESRLVTKVASGHNCWLASNTACADIMTTWISKWAETESSTNVIVLQVPMQKAPAANKNFPDDSALFGSTVHPLLQTYCANCHTNSATIPISPFFASSDVDEAYLAAKSKINLDNPITSRFVDRVKNEFHNCWSNCESDGNELIAAIQFMADDIEITELAPGLVNSQALSLFDGTLATGGGRFENDVIAKWEFKTGTGNTAFDTSGIEPAINLTLDGDFNWIGGWGIQLLDGKAQGSTASSKKIHSLLTSTGEMSIEAWLVPANVTQEGPARIISYSGSSQTRNLTLGQTLYNYDFRLSTSNTDANGEAALTTADADELLQASLQHVVITYDPVNGRQIFVNGKHADVSDSVEVGNINDWNDTYAFVLGNEVSGDIPWAGSIRLVAIHNRALTPAQIVQNFDVGIGQKFFLLFNVSEHIDIPQSYVVVEASQFDSYSYLFSQPLFISLDGAAQIISTPIKGLRLGINGREVAAGQVFENLDVSINSDEYLLGKGQALSRLGTIIEIQKGPELDEFFLTFEQLGNATNVVIEADPPAPAAATDLPPQSVIGVRNFAEINASMSSVTGVPTNNPEVKATFETLKQQLPSVTNPGSFLASNQMAITQMAIKYCDQLVASTTLRSDYFAGFDFTVPATNAFTVANRAMIINPLLDNVVGDNVASQPERIAVATELNNLIDILSICTGGKVCDANYTQTIVKATCAAMVGSATVLVQ